MNNSLLTGCANSWVVPGTLTTSQLVLPDASTFTGSLSQCKNDAGFLTSQGNTQTVSLGAVNATQGVTLTGLGFQDASLNNLPTPIQGQVVLSNTSPYASSPSSGSLYFPAGQNYISYANTTPVVFDWTASNSCFECWANFSQLPASNVALLGVGTPGSNVNVWSLNVGNTGVASIYSQITTTTTTIGNASPVAGEWLQLQCP